MTMLDWTDINTVLLDMDGTILDLHFDNHFWLKYLPERYAETHSLSLDQANDILIPKFEAERGNLYWYCVEYWSNELNIDIEALKREVRHLVGFLPTAQPFLQRLQLLQCSQPYSSQHQQSQPQHQCQIILITNAHRKSLNIKIEETQLDKFFDKIISSHDYGHAKEHTKFWQALEKDIPFNPNHTLFIDDTESILQSAHDHGIKYLLTPSQPDSQKPTRVDLKFPSFKDFNDIMPNP